ncbi:MAG: PQ-loop repeat-containing protein [Parcubacteria group bacterium]|nr:PQ-loop repeat-containing protein [Parcubacteria group bacterium]
MDASSFLTVSASLAGVMLGVSFWPQVYKVYRTKSARDLSIWMVALLLCASVVFFIYSIYFVQWPFLIANGLGIPALLLLVLGYVKYRDRRNEQGNEWEGVVAVDRAELEESAPAVDFFAEKS